MGFLSLIVAIILPSVVMGAVFYFILNNFLKEKKEERSYKLKKSLSKETLPQRLNAYERIALFLERIKPSSLAQRVTPQGDKQNYELQLMRNIQNEFDHNLSQQIYINPETWNIVYSAKNATQAFIREIAQGLAENAGAEELQEALIKQSAKENPSSRAILYLQKDIQGI